MCISLTFSISFVVNIVRKRPELKRDKPVADFSAVYNFARRLKTLKGLTPYEYICKIWTSEPEKFIVNPIHQMPGLNI